jgi:hypothetical protein
MSADELVHVYLVGKTTCPYTRLADQDLSSTHRGDAKTSVQDLRDSYDINDVVSRVYCDLPPSDPSVPQSALCSMVKSVPELVACQRQRCRILVDGYYPDYAVPAAQGVNLYLYDLKQ